LRLLNEITEGMEELKSTLNDYDYLRRYNELKQSVDLLENFKNVFDRIIQVEVTNDCKMIITLITDEIMNCCRDEFNHSSIFITA
jgi:hypothetical protein